MSETSSDTKIQVEVYSKNNIPDDGTYVGEISVTIDEKKLSNKELKELKKKEKAAKRAAKKDNKVSTEQQQQLAQLKRDKKQQQREQQLTGSKKGKQNQCIQAPIKKSTLFSHLETTEDRRATLLGVLSAISSTTASKITAAGLVIPVVSGALNTSTTLSSLPLLQCSSNSSTPIATLCDTPNSDVMQMISSMSLDGVSALVPGTSSIIPLSVEESLINPQLISSMKELIGNKHLLHPAIILLTSNIASYKIVGSIPRCLAMLEAFQLVIMDYKTPDGTTLSRNLTSYLSYQIDFLKKARPLSVTMGNAIRWLKQEISLIDPNTLELTAKEELSEKIAQFSKEKIEFADKLILENASQHITNGSTILTYGSSKVLSDLFIHNSVNLGKSFQIIIVDSRPLFEGRKMANLLRRRGLNIIYVLITSLSTVFNLDIDYIILGAHSILSNGFLYSRVGTAMIAMSASRRNIPVLVCCESLKFSQRVQLDSVTFNELADPNDLVIIDSNSPVRRHGNKGFLLRQFIKEREKQMDTDENIKPKVKTHNTSNKEKCVHETGNQSNDDSVLSDWQTLPNLNISNIMYDLTPPEYIKKVITEFGALPPSSVPVVLREYKGSA